MTDRYQILKSSIPTLQIEINGEVADSIHLVSQQKILCIKTIMSSQKHLFTYGFRSQESIKISEPLNKPSTSCRIWVLSIVRFQLPQFIYCRLRSAGRTGPRPRRLIGTPYWKGRPSILVGFIPFDFDYSSLHIFQLV